jgi:hypothetical protein
MLRVRLLLGLLAMGLFSGLLLGDDPKKPDAKPDTPAKHSLPQGWRALGLSDEQKKKIYAIEDEFEPKIAALKKQIEQLQDDEKTKKYAILTDDQKKRLKEIRDSKDGGKDDKKKDDKKDDNKDEKKP